MRASKRRPIRIYNLSVVGRHNYAVVGWVSLIGGPGNYCTRQGGQGESSQSDAIILCTERLGKYTMVVGKISTIKWKAYKILRI